MNVKITSFILIFFLLFSLTACKDDPYKDFKYNEYPEEGLSLYDVGDYKDSILNIPEKNKDGKTVTLIKGYTFNENNIIERIIIPNSVECIDHWAFIGCINLKSIHIGSGVNSIGEMIFGYCNELIEITIDKNNKTYEVINNCIIEKETGKLVAGCKSSIIPDTVKIIGPNSFAGIKQLESINFPQSVVEIDTWAFYDCNNLKSVYLDRNITVMEPAVFLYCYDLKIYTAHTEKPNGWEYDWDLIDTHEEPYTYAEIFWNTPKPVN